MFSFSCALWLAAAAVAVVVTTEASSVYNPLGSCYSSGLLIKCAHKVTCERYYSHIQCDANHVIRIHEVDYGRHDYATCAAGRSRCQVQNLFCSTPGATYKVAQRCNGRQSCSVRASNSMFGEPCPGTAKYLQVSYFCEPLKVVCQGHSATLHCAAGKVIRIHGADYGRRYRNICSAGRPYRQVRNVRCTSSTPTYDVARICNGRNNCTISASNSAFGDPCPGTYKYLHLSFFCIWLFASALVVTDGNGRVRSQFTVITCGRGSAHILACKSGVIEVVKARYGPKERTCCSAGGVKGPAKGPANPQCQQHSVTEGIKDRCEGKRVCEVHTGPCSGPCHVEYIQTGYNCVPTVCLVKCENAQVDIHCDTGKTIKIVDVFYGRRDRTTCSKGRPPSQVANVSCTGVDALIIVTDLCDGSPECTFTVNGSVFSNPCPGTCKYLHFTYYCKA